MPLTYAFGANPDAPDLVMLDTAQRSVYGPSARDAFGTEWACDEPEGWHDVDSRLPLDEPDGTDGALIGPQSVGPRTLSFGGIAIAENAVRAREAAARLRNAVAPLRGLVTFTITEDDGLRLSCSGYPQGKFRARIDAGRVLIYDFTIVCPDATKVSAVTTSRTISLPDPSASPGITVPFTLGSLVFATEAPTGGSTIAPNDGDAEAWPIVTLTGPLLLPTVRNRTTGRYSQWNIELDRASVMQVDTRTGLTTIDGVQRFVPLVGYASTLWPLVPGRNDVELRTAGTYDPTARAELAWRHTYR